MMIQSFPTLSTEARKVLEIIVNYTSIDGSTLMKLAGSHRPSDLITPILELQTQQLIEVGGSVTAEGLPFSRFGVRPSAKEYLHSLLKQK
jgi:hypothetical protein